MEQHFKDQIKYIMESFDFDKARQVMIYLGWSWGNNGQSPDVQLMKEAAEQMLKNLINRKDDVLMLENIGLRAEIINKYRLRLSFVIESVDGTDIVGDEGL